MAPIIGIPLLIAGYGVAIGAATYIGAKTLNLLEKTEDKLVARIQKRKAKVHVIHGGKEDAK